MRRSVNLINNVVTFAVTIALVVVAVILCNRQFYSPNMMLAIGLYVVGALVAGFVNTVIHELGHVVFGKMNGFALLSCTIWFFKWARYDGKLRFSLVMMGDEAGSTEMVANGTDNLVKRYKRLSFGGICGSLVITLISVVPFCMGEFMPFWAYCLLVPFLPVSVYYLLGNALPIINGGFRNDGAVLLGLMRNDNVSQVTVSLLAIQAQLFGGKTPAQVDKSYYYDVPQLAEDEITFILLLNARYSYHLDMGDDEGVKKVSDRILSVMDYIPKSMQPIFKADLLYNACTTNYNENLADELMYECEKYLNGVNTATSVRIKLAYKLNVLKDYDNVNEFYEKGIREVKRSAVKGYAAFEEKLLDSLYQTSNVQD